MNPKTFFLVTAVLFSTAAGAGASSAPRFKSPSGRFEVVFTTGNDKNVPFYLPKPSNPPPGLKPHYLLLFYKVGSSDPVCADWYTDAGAPPAPSDIARALIWSPQEDFVVVTHGQNSPQPGFHQWVVSLSGPYEYGFQGGHPAWVDRYRLVADITTKDVPGGIELVDAQKRKGELVISPHTGIGYAIAASSGPRVTVKEFLNHWGDAKEKTSWDVFEPACFDLDLDTLKKRSVPCPK